MPIRRPLLLAVLVLLLCAGLFAVWLNLPTAGDPSVAAAPSPVAAAAQAGDPAAAPQPPAAAQPNAASPEPHLRYAEVPALDFGEPQVLQAELVRRRRLIPDLERPGARLVVEEDFAATPADLAADPQLRQLPPQRALSSRAYVADRLLVRLRPGADEAALRRVLRAVAPDGQIARPLLDGRTWVVDFAKTRGADAMPRLAKALAAQPGVAGAGRDYLVYATTTPDDLNDKLWGLHNTGQTGGIADVDIDAPEAWSLTTGSRSVKRRHRTLYDFQPKTTQDAL